MKPVLVLHCMSYYARYLDGVVNRNMHIADELEKRRIFKKIILIDMLPYNVRSAVRSSKNLYALDRKKISSQSGVYSRLFSIAKERELIAPTPLFYMSSKKRRMHLLEKAIRHLEGTKGTRIAWSYNPFDLSFLDKKVYSQSVFDAVDDWRHNPVYRSSMHTLQDNYGYIASSCDTIFSVSEYLVEMFKNEYNRSDVRLIPNTSELSVRNAGKAIHKNSIVYLGTIESRFDIELVEFLVQKNPTKHFTFIGPVWKEQRARFNALCEQKNTSYLGEKKFSKDIGSLLPTFDAGIIPHVQSRFSQSNDPLKVYDYLRAGLPVVSTIPTSESSLTPYVYLADEPEAFNTALAKALAENSPRRIKERQDAMSSITWERRVDAMLSCVNI